MYLIDPYVICLNLHIFIFLVSMVISKFKLNYLNPRFPPPVQSLVGGAPAGAVGAGIAVYGGRSVRDETVRLEP